MVRAALVSAVCAAWVTAARCEGATSDVKNVAIIGAGAAGSSAAYHLQKYAEAEELSVNITIFEKTHRIGGRTLTVNPYDDPSLATELGASIFVDVNYILYQAAQEFNLSLGGMSELEADDITIIWDGETIVHQSTSGTSWWWDVAKLWWKYGRSPYYAVKLVKSVVNEFLRLYDEPYFPFRSLTQRSYELGLQSKTSITGWELLDQHGINPAFSREIIQAATRVNYASNLAYIHGLETMVSFTTDGAFQVQGGNWQIFDNFVKRSGAAFYGNTTVGAISLDETRDSESSPRYIISTKDSASSAETAAEPYGIAFDNVVIASPWQFSDISASRGILGHHIDEIPYTKLHVTLFASSFRLRPGFFGLEPGSRAPRNVYTTLGAGEHAKNGPEGVGRAGFYSISTLKTGVDPRTGRREFIYKIFSPEVVTAKFLTDILGAEVPETFVADPDAELDVVNPISWYHPAWFYSYPQELPRVTFQDPIVGDGLYYTSGIESFISTMETSALMGKNVARLIADDFAGIQRDQSCIQPEDGFICCRPQEAGENAFAGCSDQEMLQQVLLGDGVEFGGEL